MIFKDKELIYFLHIYKTAGTTINNLLFNNFNNQQIINLYVPNLSTGQMGEIFNIYENIQISNKTKIIYGHYAYGIHRKFPKKKYSYMCFVRDPYQRLLSTYFHLKRLELTWQFEILKHLSDRYKSPNDVLNFFPSIEEYFLFDGIQNQQCMFLTGFNPKVIKTNQLYYAKMAIENLEREFSFIGLQEEFEESILRLKTRLNLKTLQYDYKNFGNNKSAIIDNDKTLKDICNKKSEADFMIFEYVKSRFYSKSVI